MKGTIRIINNSKGIKVRGCIVNPSITEQIACIDALMCTFGIEGDTRKVACEILMRADEKRAEKKEATK